MSLNHRFPSFRLLLLLLLASLLVAGCGGSKKAVDKKVTKVSEISHNDIKETGKKTLEKEILVIQDNFSISITPEDSSRETVFIKGKDTLKVINGKIDINKSSSTTNTLEKHTEENTREDYSIIEKENYTREVSRDVEKGSGFFAWIGILVLILLLLYVLYWLAKKYSWFGRLIP